MKLTLWIVAVCSLSALQRYVRAECGAECYPSKYDDSLDADEDEVEDRLFGGLFISLSSKMTNNYFLFTRDNPEGELFNETLDTTWSSFDASKNTTMIAHGFTSDSQTGYTELLAEAYLNQSDMNVIGIDWSQGAKNLLYNVAARSVQSAGKQLAAFIDVLAENFNFPPENLHLVGHSLGAHVVGIANHHTTSGKIGRVTGLDPAAPLYHTAKVGERISTESGNFVDVIHTCGRTLGLFAPLGHADFYSYKGVATQPGCSILDNLQGGMCSHSKAWLIYIESIENPSAYKATKCDNYNLYSKNKCDNNSFTYLGEDTDRNATGVHYFTISSA